MGREVRATRGERERGRERDRDVSWFRLLVRDKKSMPKATAPKPAAPKTAASKPSSGNWTLFVYGNLVSQYGKDSGVNFPKQRKSKRARERERETDRERERESCPKSRSLNL